VGPKFEVPRALTESPGRGPPTASYLPAAALGAGTRKGNKRKKKEHGSVPNRTWVSDGL